MNNTDTLTPPQDRIATPQAETMQDRSKLDDTLCYLPNTELDPKSIRQSMVRWMRDEADAADLLGLIHDQIAAIVDAVRSQNLQSNAETCSNRRPMENDVHQEAEEPEPLLPPRLQSLVKDFARPVFPPPPPPPPMSKPDIDELYAVVLSFQSNPPATNDECKAVTAGIKRLMKDQDLEFEFEGKRAKLCCKAGKSGRLFMQFQYRSHGTTGFKRPFKIVGIDDPISSPDPSDTASLVPSA